MHSQWTYWVVTCTKKVIHSIHLLNTEAEALKVKKKYEKDGWFVLIEKK